MDRKKELLVRMYLVMLAFIVLSVVIIARVAKVAIVEGDKWREKGDKNIQLRPVYAERGNIYSEEYNLLATSLKFFEIHMDLTVVKEDIFRRDVDSLAYCLSKSVGQHKSSREWKQDLINARKAKKRYFTIARKVTIDDYLKLKEFPIFRLGRFKGGLRADRFEVRTKPFRSFAGRTIGDDRENAVKTGLEGYFDQQLSGETLEVLMKKVATDTWVPVYDMSELEQRSGNDIVSTINVSIQDIVHHETLSRAVELKAKAATAIVMEVETGAIKAISNFRMQSDSSYAEVYNDAVGNVSEPGSTFKLATVLALMDDGHCDLETLVDLEKGKARFYDKYVYDSDWHGLNMVTLRQAFEKSSNVGIAKLADEYYNKDTEGRVHFIEKLKAFGLVDKTGVEITGEGTPFIKDPIKNKKEWWGTTIPWMSHGYELTMTPLQLLSLYNTVANDGTMMKPYLVSDILQDDEVVKHFDPRVEVQQIANAKAISAAQELLEGVVLNGTGKKLQSDIVTIAGKTGTTRTNYARQEEEKRYNASFAGYFPVDAPKYSMIVVMYEPGGSVYYGASAAGPAFKRIAERISALGINMENERYGSELIASNDLPGSNSGFGQDFQDVFEYVGLEYRSHRNTRWVEIDPSEVNMNIDKKKISTTTVPDVRGMGARDAIYVLENLGMTVDIAGAGKVVKQTIKPGTKLKGQDVTIYLN